MTRRLFKEEMSIHIGKVKELFLAEYFSGCCCLKKDEEKKLQNAIRKINAILEEMEDEYT